MKKIIPLLLVTIALPACGNKTDLRSEKKTVDFAAAIAESTGKQSTQEQGTIEPNLSPQEFNAACQKKGGIIEQNGTICLYEIKSSDIANGQPVTSETIADMPIATIASGNAILALGNVKDRSVEIVLNGNPISTVPSPSNRLITTDGGELAFRLRPGSFSGVKVFVYGCLSQSMQETRCPF